MNPNKFPSSEEQLRKTRTERPDKAAFSAFIGVFLLIIGICFGVWAHWTFQKYRYATNYAENLRRNPNASANGNYNQDDIIRENKIFADHDFFETIWTGAISLILLSGATILFVRSFRIYRRMKRNEYEAIDWRALSKPTTKIDVTYRRNFSAAAIIFYVFFGSLTLLVVSNGIRFQSIVIGSMNLLIILVIVFLRMKASRKSVKSFDVSGVTRGDKRHFLWSDFRGVIQRIGVSRFAANYNWRTELVFANSGEAWVIPQRIKNYEEIYKFIDALPPAVLKN